MTREQLIDYIAGMLWIRGIGSKGGGREAAADIVDELVAKGVLTVRIG